MADAIRAASSTALSTMRELGDTADEVIETLVCFRDSKGLTALHLACIKGHADAAGELMQLGANPFAMVSTRHAGNHNRHLHMLWFVATTQQEWPLQGLVEHPQL